MVFIECDAKLTEFIFLTFTFASSTYIRATFDIFEIKEMNLFFFIFIFLVFFTLGKVEGHERFWGECPSFKAMENFDWIKVI
jgi:hypothetical protein